MHLSNLFVVACAASAVSVSQSAQAALILSFGEAQLGAGTTVTVPLLVESTDGSDLVSGVNLIAAVGDGGPLAGGVTVDPDITGVQFLVPGGLLASAGVTDAGVDAGSVEQVAQVNIAFLGTVKTVTVPQSQSVLATITLDYGSLVGSSFQLSTEALGVGTTFVAPGGATLSPTQASTTVVIPEPAAGLALAAVGALALRRRRV